MLSQLGFITQTLFTSPSLVANVCAGVPDLLERVGARETSRCELSACLKPKQQQQRLVADEQQNAIPLTVFFSLSSSLLTQLVVVLVAAAATATAAAAAAETFFFSYLETLYARTKNEMFKIWRPPLHPPPPQPPLVNFKIERKAELVG